MKVRVTPTRPGQWEYNKDGLLVDVETGQFYEKQVIGGELVDYTPSVTQSADAETKGKRGRKEKQS